MFPVGHGVNAQFSTPPFSIKLSQNVYTPWEEMRISVSAKNGHVIRGLFVQARRADCTHPQQKHPIGTFQLLGEEKFLRTMPCFDIINSSLSHVSNPGLMTAVFKWYAPAVRAGHLYFVATVVETKKVFWTNVYSEILRDLSSQSAAMICPARYLNDPTVPEENTTWYPSTTQGSSSSAVAADQTRCTFTFWLCIVGALLIKQTCAMSAKRA